jgi:ergothioneine biosynthesis protein EgtB
VTPLLSSYRSVRARTLSLCESLEAEDYVIQSMPDVSPTKWHLAHVTWFFERFVLRDFLDAYTVFDEQFDHLFNSYYYSAGSMHPRACRGLLSRPTVSEVMDYRAHVDSAISRLLSDHEASGELADRVVLGINHEQQHQELLLTDIKHVFSCHPGQPAVKPGLAPAASKETTPLRFLAGESGIVRVGADPDAFCFDNETPRHETLLAPHLVASRLVTNGEYLEFIRDGGYRRHEVWLSDGWATLKSEGWDRPLYWGDDLQSEFTLGGVRELDRAAPVTHISYYEADAFSRWAGCRLPTEQEWERTARNKPHGGNLLESGFWHPNAEHAESGQFFGDTWEWTSSAYAPYPGFQPLAGSLGEYNGKFMCNQMTVRGGSCVTARDHIRASYRSFFYPASRWQFLGFRLAKDGAADH